MNPNSQKIFDVEKIHLHKIGWEDEWGQLAEALIGTDDLEFKKSILYESCAKIVNSSAGFKTVPIDEFVSAVFCNYLERAEKQSLFTEFDVEKGDAIRFLCSWKNLKALFYAFRIENSSIRQFGNSKKKQTLSQVELDEDAPQYADTTPIMKEAAPLKSLEERLNALVIHRPKKGSRSYQQAGLQLYPRLSKTDAEMTELHDSARHDVAQIQENSESEADAQIQGKHHEAAVLLEENITKTYIRLKEKPCMNTKHREKLTDRMANLQRRQILFPLDSHVISELLNLKENTAVQCIRRYRLDLEELFEDYYKMYNFLQGGNEE